MAGDIVVKGLNEPGQTKEASPHPDESPTAPPTTDAASPLARAIGPKRFDQLLLCSDGPVIATRPEAEQLAAILNGILWTGD